MKIKHLKKFGACLALASSTLLMANNTSAAAVIFNTGDETTATVALGVNDLGHLNTSVGNVATNASATGLSYKDASGAWVDATSPGCLCEGWGAAADGISGYANVSGGTAGLTLTSFSSTTSTATSIVTLTSLPGLTITHEYKPSASSALFEAVVTMTNTSAVAMTDTRYTRAMDWDVPPTEFAEYVTIAGTATTTDLLFSSDNGFATSNPLGSGRTDLAGCGTTTDFIDCGSSDHGALFDFGFGDLAAGESKTFSIFYGAAGTEVDALAALGTVGAELYSLGQSSTADGPTLGTPTTFIFGFSGVGGTVLIPPPAGVPEASSLMLMVIGLLGFGATRRKRG